MIFYRDIQSAVNYLEGNVKVAEFQTFIIIKNILQIDNKEIDKLQVKFNIFPRFKK